MNIKAKRIFARELLMIVLSSAICLIAFGIGVFLDNIQNEKNQKKSGEASSYDSQIDNYIIGFRKNPKVDSLYKLQMNFYSDYCNLINTKNYDNGNYFFWIKVRKSIADSTFNFTYANDEIIQKFEQSSYYNKNIREILYAQHYLNNDVYKSIDWKLQFKLFALNNNYEKYLSPLEWKNYQELRERRIHLGDVEYLIYYYNHNQRNFIEIALVICVCILFLLRYLVYVIMWGIKILKSKEL